MEHNSLKAYGPSDTNDRDNFMLTFHNSLFYYMQYERIYAHFHIFGSMECESKLQLQLFILIWT